MKDKVDHYTIKEKRTKFGILTSFLYFCRQIVKQNIKMAKKLREIKTRHAVRTGWLQGQERRTN